MQMQMDITAGDQDRGTVNDLVKKKLPELSVSTILYCLNRNKHVLKLVFNMFIKLLTWQEMLNLSQCQKQRKNIKKNSIYL